MKKLPKGPQRYAELASASTRMRFLGESEIAYPDPETSSG